MKSNKILLCFTLLTLLLTPDLQAVNGGNGGHRGIGACSGENGVMEQMQSEFIKNKR